MSKKVIFRVLRADEKIEYGITAKDPNKKMRLSVFIRMGTKLKKGSQFIATTTDFATAYNWANEDVTKRNVPLEKVRIAIIDASMLDDCEVLDMSTRESGEAVLKSRADEVNTSEDYCRIALNYSVASNEIDIVGTIRPEAFTVHYLADIRTAMDKLVHQPIPGGIVQYLKGGK